MQVKVKKITWFKGGQEDYMVSIKGMKNGSPGRKLSTCTREPVFCTAALPIALIKAVAQKGGLFPDHRRHNVDHDGPTPQPPHWGNLALIKWTSIKVC